MNLTPYPASPFWRVQVTTPPSVAKLRLVAKAQASFDHCLKTKAVVIGIGRRRVLDAWCGSPTGAGEAAALVLATQEFVANGGGRSSLRRRRSAASPGGRAAVGCWSAWPLAFQTTTATRTVQDFLFPCDGRLLDSPYPANSTRQPDCRSRRGDLAVGAPALASFPTSGNACRFARAFPLREFETVARKTRCNVRAVRSSRA